MKLLITCTVLICVYGQDHINATAAPEYTSLYSPSFTSVFGFFVATVGLAIAAGGGIGGGGILVPVYVIAWHFPTKLAIPLSTITIMGGACANLLFNVRKRHPNPNIRRPLIDYDLVLMMEPTTIIGSMIGALMTKFIPDWIISISLVVLLTATTLRTWIKYTVLVEQEKRLDISLSPLLLQSYRRSSSIPLIMYDSSVKSESVASLPHEAERMNSYGSNYSSRKLREQLDLYDLTEAEAHFPWFKVFYLLLIELGTLVLILSRGTAFLNPFHIECGSTSYLLMLLAPIVWVGLNFAAIRYYYVSLYKKKRYLGYKFCQGDIRWTARNSIVFPLICTLAGFFAGMFGIGGGIVKGPLMLEMGTLPEVAAATSTFMILFTSGSAFFVYVASGTVVFEYASYVFLMGFVSTLFGQAVVSHLVGKSRKTSLIVLLICIVIGFSTVLMGYQSIKSTLSNHPVSSGLCS